MPCIRNTIATVACLLIFLCRVVPGWAGETLTVEKGVSVVGSLTIHRVAAGESLHEVAVRHGLGYNEIVDANSEIDPWVPETGTSVLVPHKWVLPEGDRKGIVINLAEMRLYHYATEEGKDVVHTYAVGIGREAFETPLGSFLITEKLTDPPWHVPASVKQEFPELPPVVPPGPENPLGKYALRLSNPEYLIHGTNRPFGIGRKVSHGCIRLYPDDIKELHASVKIGRRVSIIYQSVKLGVRGDEIFIEAHKDHLRREKEQLASTVARLRQLGLLKRVDTMLLYRALAERTGVPTPIAKRP